MNRVWMGGGYVELTGALDGLSHHISGEAFSAAMARGSGQYKVMCGRTVVAASMAAEPGRTCRECAEALRTAGAS